MSIKYVSGEIFLNQYNAQAFAHGCNCQGVMGAGIALRFKEDYPAMYVEYRRRCKARPRQFNLGDAFLWKEESKPHVFNLATQELPGPHATYQAIETSMISMMNQAEVEHITSIAIPKVGSMLGGLEWPKVRAVVAKVFSVWTGTLHVYQ